MSFIQTIPQEEATGAVADIYAADIAGNGFLPHYTQVFSLRPEVYQAWRTLISSIRGNMDLRRYELVTLAAANKLRCSYCMLAHGGILKSKFFPQEQVEAIVRDYRTAGLSDVDVAVMTLAEKVAANAYKVVEEDHANLRALGLTDPEILDVILAASARCFFSKVLDATGAIPDQEVYNQMEDSLKEALVVGRQL